MGQSEPDQDQKELAPFSDELVFTFSGAWGEQWKQAINTNAATKTGKHGRRRLLFRLFEGIRRGNPSTERDLCRG